MNLHARTACTRDRQAQANEKEKFISTVRLIKNTLNTSSMIFENGHLDSGDQCAYLQTSHRMPSWFAYKGAIPPQSPFNPKLKSNIYSFFTEKEASASEKWMEESASSWFWTKVERSSQKRWKRLRSLSVSLPKNSTSWWLYTVYVGRDWRTE